MPKGQKQPSPVTSSASVTTCANMADELSRGTLLALGAALAKLAVRGHALLFFLPRCCVVFQSLLHCMKQPCETNKLY